MPLCAGILRAQVLQKAHVKEIGDNESSDALNTADAEICLNAWPRPRVTNKRLAELSIYNLQPRQHRLIQQINRLIEPFILYECSISLLSCLDRSMAQKMLNVSDGSTAAQ
jgi:hypothetical protein